MWRMLAAKEWVAAGKLGRARHCLDEALPAYEGSQLSGIVAFAEALKEASGYTPLIALGDDKKGESEERLDLGSKRKSLAVPAQEELELLGTDFVES